MAREEILPGEESVGAPEGPSLGCVCFMFVAGLLFVFALAVGATSGPSIGDTRTVNVNGQECVEQYQSTGGFFSDSQWKIVSCGGGR